MTTAPDMLKQFGGVPVASDRFAGWWGNDVWFVDYDNGVATSQKGKNDIGNPQKDLAQTITDAGAGDVIYMRPRTTVYRYGSSPTVITPASATNWTIPYGKHDLSIIGTSAHGGLTHGVSLRSYASLTTPTLQINAQYCTLENLGFQAIAEQVNTGMVYVFAYTSGVQEGYACTVNRCNFQVYKSSVGAALKFDSSRYNQCLNSEFWHNYVSILLASTGGNIHGNTIRGNIFRGATTDIDADIVIADATHIQIDSNIFDHAIPAYTSGIRLVYIDCVGTATGMISNNYFATTTQGFDDVNDFSNMVDTGNICGSDTAWMTST